MEEKENKENKDKNLLNKEERKKIRKEMGKILFMPNDEIDENWTDAKLSLEETKILSEGEKYIKEELIKNLEINRTGKRTRAKELEKEEKNKKQQEEEKKKELEKQREEKTRKEEVERQIQNDRQR